MPIQQFTWLLNTHQQGQHPIRLILGVRWLIPAVDQCWTRVNSQMPNKSCFC